MSRGKHSAGGSGIGAFVVLTVVLGVVLLVVYVLAVR